MALQDRDYMRERHARREAAVSSPSYTPSSSAPPPPSPTYRPLAAFWHWILAGVLVLIAAIAWLLWQDGQALEKRGLRVNVNTATVDQLQTLPGVGPIIATRIIKARPFKTAGDLARVKGIGAKRARGLAPLVTVTGETERSGGGALLERLRKRVTRANRGPLFAYLACAWVGLAYVIGWFAEYLQRRRNARTRAEFENAEWRRWEGHRRE